ncbi:MAG: MMPL family transporter [Clostridiales bacterium]|nr:MMPL family transporter [Clostridiales bacterium]
MLKKLADFIVDKRIFLIIFMVALGVAGAILMGKVTINEDMSKYLPDDSNMRHGVDIMDDSFPKMEQPNTVRVMVDDLTDEQKTEMVQRLSQIENIDSVDYEPGNSFYNKDNHTLYVLNTSCDYDSDEMEEIEQALENDFEEFDLKWANDDDSARGLPLRIVIVCVILIMVILFFMCESWFEPILFLGTIGIAVLINLGTNYFKGDVASVTNSMAAILQLGLSMDYSIILMNRYRQERENEPDKIKAMKTALYHAFASVASSSLTTVVGLMMLCFMSMKIGADLGIVLGKGVFISMICVLTILPGLIIYCDKILTKTAKHRLKIPTGWAAAFSHKARYIVTYGFMILFIVVTILQSRTGIEYTIEWSDEVSDVFPRNNQIVLVYENEDEENIGGLIELLNEDENVHRIDCYKTSIGIQYTAEEMKAVFEAQGAPIDLDLIDMVYSLRFADPDRNDPEMSIDELYNFVTGNILNNPQYESLIDDQTRLLIAAGSVRLEDAKSVFVSEKYSRLIMSTIYKDEGDEINDFFDRLNEYTDSNFKGDSYLIGNAAMTHEMKETFDNELTFITTITAAAIFLIVMLTFRSFTVPAILVLIVQCGVYITIVANGLLGGSMFYLAVLIVECILMGATIDYGILFTNYYRESRQTMNERRSLARAYEGSIHTIMTSGLILIVVTAIVANMFEEKTVQAIVQTISIGAFCAVLLILFVLPGVLAVIDRKIVRLKAKRMS